MKQPKSQTTQLNKITNVLKLFDGFLGSYMSHELTR